jgi:hypothetical protein
MKLQMIFLECGSLLHTHLENMRIHMDESRKRLDNSSFQVRAQREE